MSPVDLVTLGALSLKKEGNYNPYYVEIQEWLIVLNSTRPIPGYNNPDQIKSTVIDYLSSVPNYITSNPIYRAICLPVNAKFYLNGRKPPVSIDQAKIYLTHGYARIAGVYFMTEEDDPMCLAYYYREKGKADRKDAKIDNRVVLGTELGLISKPTALGYLTDRKSVSLTRLMDLEKDIT
jgi:hypothetical protein